MKITSYSPDTETAMRNFYHSLSEKDRRRYAAIEAQKLGRGGKTYIRKLLGCNARTLDRGMSEISQPLPEHEKRIRLEGGGRKSILATMPEIDHAFQHILIEHTAGSPENEAIKWTNLKREDIATHLEEAGFKVSVTVVDQLLKKHNYRRRQAFKTEAGKDVEHRDEQFHKIAKLKKEYHEKGNPVMSMDVKKKN